MRKIFFLVALIGTMRLFAEDTILGEEYIEPLHYPKFSLLADYDMMRKVHILGQPSIGTASLKNNFNFILGYDVGLYKYFNAGALFGTEVGRDLRNTLETTFLRFSLYGKPFIPMGDRFSIFGRFSGGFSVAIVNMLSHLTKSGSADLVNELSGVYGEQGYADFSPGANAAASIGVEVFPFSRMGIALEWGIRAEYFYSSKGSAARNLAGIEKNIDNSPNSFQYLLYSMPLTLNLHMIF